jgi:CRP-like cAMP-binding protein
MSTQSDIDLDSAVARVRAGLSSATGGGLLPRNWTDTNWRDLLRFTTPRRVAAGEALIRRGEHDATLYFVLRGELEVVVHSGDGISMGPLTRIGAGSVLGEQSFFDGEPRSASVWAAGNCEVAAMTPAQFRALEESHPALARDLIFALGRILATRLRRTTARVTRQTGNP